MPAFLLPDLGEGLTEAEVVTWHVQVGDIVAVDQIVVEVETAKAAVEIPVPFAGRVAALHGRPGDVLTVGEPLITVDRANAAASDDGVSDRVLVGYGPAGPAGARRRARRTAATSPARPPATALASAAAAAAGRPGNRVTVVSPAVRRLALESGIDLTAVRGSGRDGLITRQDVEQAVTARQAVAAPAAGPASARASDAALVRIPLRGLRKAVADKFSRSRREIPEATVWVDADATDLLALRAQLNSGERAAKISLLALISRFAVLGLGRYPALNARIEDSEIVTGPSVHLGVATQTDRGLVVPVVPDAQAHDLERLARALAECTGRARTGRLGPGDLTGGTFTINNYGLFGVDGSAAIINYPEVAILGLGRIIQRPWVVDGQVVARHVTQLTLAFDHRACDGGTAGGFLRFVADCVESPADVLALHEAPGSPSK